MPTYTSDNPLFRSLNEGEVKEFVQWALNNYAVLPPAERNNPVYHPVVRDTFNKLDKMIEGLSGTFNFKRDDYLSAYLFTPLRADPIDVDLKQIAPGISVKTVRKEPQLFGKVQTYSNRYDGECVVVGHGWLNTEKEEFVWKGTKEEFDRTWDGD